MGITILTIVVIGLAMLGMAVGTIFSDRCLRGSCGGPEVLDASGEPLNCDTCPHRPEKGEAPLPQSDTTGA